MNLLGSTAQISENPLVSIHCWCKNRADTIKRALDSVLTQSYRNIEVIIQDGASTDGTLEIIRAYNDPRIKLISEPDSGMAEAHWKALNRCTGEIIGTCLSDDELVPGAIETAVKRFQAEPYLGAVTGDSYLCDMNGNIYATHVSSDFDLVKYLFGHYCPFFPATFFSRQALLDVGLEAGDWEIDHCLEYEIWFRLGTRHTIKYFPGVVSKYAMHAEQSSQNYDHASKNIDGWIRLINKWFSKDGFFGDDADKRNAAIYNRLYETYNHFRAYKIEDVTEKLYHRIQAFKKEVYGTGNVYNHFQNITSFFGPYWEGWAIPGKGLLVSRAMAYTGERIKHVVHMEPEQAVSRWISLMNIIPSFLKKSLPSDFKHKIQNIFFKVTCESNTVPVTSLDVNDLVPLKYTPKLYNYVASLYCARGQIDQAIQMWRAAGNKDEGIADGHACGAAQKSYLYTPKDILELQQWWVKRHAPILPLPPLQNRPYDGNRRINIGYHCSWMDSELFVVLLGAVLTKHNREKFRVIGYSRMPLGYKQQGMFDELRITGKMTNEQFVKTVRADEVDILLEISGFSDGNRFSAMASRCAPIQIAHVNHHATTAVPNIDYLFTDATSIPPGAESYFTEQPYRLPGCFLIYNFDHEPPTVIGPQPKSKKGNVTFGCFGDGSKINNELIWLWAQVLLRVPNSIMLICNKQLALGNTKQFTVERFQRFGIGSERLRLIDGLPREKALDCLRDEVDISLDTWPYCGGFTIAESLFHGIPVVTLLGDLCAARYGASILRAAGCSELIAATAQDYIEIAASISADDIRLEYYRRNLRRMMHEFGLSDLKGYAQKLEAAYEDLLQNQHNVAAQRRSINSIAAIGQAEIASG